MSEYNNTNELTFEEAEIIYNLEYNDEDGRLENSEECLNCGGRWNHDYHCS